MGFEVSYSVSYRIRISLLLKKWGLCGGLAMLWKEDIRLDVFKYSDNQISAWVTESDGFRW